MVGSGWKKSGLAGDRELHLIDMWVINLFWIKLGEFNHTDSNFTGLGRIIINS